MSGPSGLPLHDSPAQRPSIWAPHRPPFGSTLDDFCSWTEWVDTAYELDLPDCWALHEGLVHTLASLWHAWRAVYAQPGSPSSVTPAHGGPIQWHTSHLLPLRDRLMRPDGVPGAGCRTRVHREYTRTHSVAETLAPSFASADEDAQMSNEEARRVDDLDNRYYPAAAIERFYR